MGNREVPREDRPDKTYAAHMGRSVRLTGELRASEDLTVDGQLVGRIELPEHALAIGPNADIKTDIVAGVVTIFGSVTGNVTARDKVEIRRGGSLQGTLTSARIAIQDGAHFCGNVEMERRTQQIAAAQLVAV